MRLAPTMNAVAATTIAPPSAVSGVMRSSSTTHAAIVPITGCDCSSNEPSHASTNRCDHATERWPIRPGTIAISTIQAQSDASGGRSDVPVTRDADVTTIAETNITLAM